MLTVVQIQALKPTERPFKVFDSDGLYLLVQPSGALLWRFRYAPLPDGFPRHWQDDANKIESKLSEVAAAVIAAGEARYRLSIVERLEQIARMEARHEQQRREALARRNKERLAALHRSAEMLRQADDLRALIAAVGSAIEKGHHSLDAKAFAEWKIWAAGEADRLDPVISGQVDEHLLPASAPVTSGRLP